MKNVAVLQLRPHVVIDRNDLKNELKAETDRRQQSLSTYLARFNQVVQRLGLEPISEK
jgi:hypothetical protein